METGDDHLPHTVNGDDNHHHHHHEQQQQKQQEDPDEGGGGGDSAESACLAHLGAGTKCGAMEEDVLRLHSISSAHLRPLKRSSCSHQSPPSDLHESEVNDCVTPTGPESRIPDATACPPAPKKKRRPSKSIARAIARPNSTSNSNRSSINASDESALLLCLSHNQITDNNNNPPINSNPSTLFSNNLFPLHHRHHHHHHRRLIISHESVDIHSLFKS